MNKISITFILILFVVTAKAQSPQSFSYQAIIRNTENELVAESQISMRISILSDSAGSTIIYNEQHQPTTNAGGLVTIQIGKGETTDDFTLIDWRVGPYFIKTEIDPNGGNAYIFSIINQLLSVPYALHANTATALTEPYEEADPYYNNSPASGISQNDIDNWNRGGTLHGVPSSGASESDVVLEMLNAGLYGVVTDLNGNSYKTIKVGDRIWMTENSRYVSEEFGFGDGTRTTRAIIADELGTEPYRWYNDDSITNAIAEGRLYNIPLIYNAFSELTTGIPHGNKHTLISDFVCPGGFRIPNEIDVAKLAEYGGHHATKIQDELTNKMSFGYIGYYDASVSSYHQLRPTSINEFVFLFWNFKWSWSGSNSGVYDQAPYVFQIKLYAADRERNASNNNMLIEVEGEISEGHTYYSDYYPIRCVKEVYEVDYTVPPNDELPQ